MGLHLSVRRALRGALIVGIYAATAAAGAVAQQAARSPLALNTAKITIEGTSNVHPYTASTTTVRLARARVGEAVTGAEFFDAIVKPGGLADFEITIPVATLVSPKGDLDKNMHKALKAQTHAEIAFRLVRVEPRAGGVRAIGMLRIAGVERETALDLAIERTGTALAISGQVELVMTDFGVTPPKAMLGMLRTDPKVTVKFETVLGVSLT